MRLPVPSARRIVYDGHSGQKRRNDRQRERGARGCSKREPRRSRPVLFSSSALVVLVGVVLIAGWLLRKSASGSIPVLSTPFALEKLSTDGGVFHIAISPDGKNVVYTHREGGRQSVWLRQLETSNNVPIVPESTDFYGGLVIAPDGNSVYFVRGMSNGTAIEHLSNAYLRGCPAKDHRRDAGVDQPFEERRQDLLRSVPVYGRGLLFALYRGLRGRTKRKEACFSSTSGQDRRQQDLT